MLKGCRFLLAAALAALFAGPAAFAQTQPPPETNTVGNPQLRDFELPGTRTTPPATQPPVVPATPPAQAQPDSRPPAAQTPPPETARPASPRQEQPAASTAQPKPAPEQEAPAPEAPTLPTPGDVSEALPQPIAPRPLAPEAAATEPSAPMPAEEQGGGIPWLYIGLAALAAVIALSIARKALVRGGREVVESDAEPAPAPEVPAPVRASEPTPVAAARPAPRPATPVAPTAPSGTIGIQLRPWLELEFRPDRAAATDREASVQFELLIRNRGNAPAQNVRVEARMFNAGGEQEREINAFFAEPIRERTLPAIAAMVPRDQVSVKSTVSLPKEQVKEIEVQGRRLFIPLVAFNVVYDWGNGRSGQTSMSYLVGREPEAPSQKMGAFRLDLGPRLYRSVGQRRTELARVV